MNTNNEYSRKFQILYVLVYYGKKKLFGETPNMKNLEELFLYLNTISNMSLLMSLSTYKMLQSVQYVSSI